MKTIRLTSVLTFYFSIALPAWGRADVGWASNNFWRSPVVTSVEFSLSEGGKALHEACDHFENLMAKTRDEKLRRKIFESERETPLFMYPLQSRFSYEFESNLDSFGDVLNQSDRDRLARIAAVEARSEKRLYYVQSADSIHVDISTFAMEVVESEEESLTSIGKSLGLSQLPVLFTKSFYGVKLLVYGKDLACDLARGRAKLIVSADAYALLNLDKATLPLTVLYFKLSEIVNEVLAKFERPTQRAALLGYRLGEFLASRPDMTNERAETAMLSFLDTYLDPETLTHNSLWSTGLKEEKLLSFSSVSKPFLMKVTFAKEKNQ